MKKRIFALLGIVSILVSMLTITAFAADDDSIVRNLEEDQGTVDPYAQEWMTATFSLPNGVSNLGAKVVNNFAVIPSDVALLNFIATGPCVDGSCPYKVDWNGFDEDGDYVMEGTYELHISASVDDSSDTDIAYVTVVHTENMLKDFEIDKVRRNLEWMKAGSSMDKDELLKARANFYKFFTQHDERRYTDFLSTFPEMEDWWNICKEAEALI